ncbi:uncharacterized protein LOC128964677 [Oppia nitens]|uniref:uncharacterized protein LOC128964677 n=1 Tax=Oppia nitens TaxID=1686743 RepID=UPI0023D9B294|nr:uncharacterized protein LOC128964677 [Oppia nitens]
MNQLEEQLTEWSERELNVKVVNSKESFNCLRTKNGLSFKKLLTYMSEFIKSQENGQSIKLFNDSVLLEEEIRNVKTNVDSIELRVNSVRNEFTAEQLKRNCQQSKVSHNEHKLFLSTLLVDVCEKISLKNKYGTQLQTNLLAINAVIDSNDKLFHSSDIMRSNDLNNLNDNHNNSNGYGTNWRHFVEEINQLVESINYVINDLYELKVVKPVSINFDLDLLSKSLTQSDPHIEVVPHKVEKELRNSLKISTKLTTINNLMEKYQTIRTEKLAKNKDKMSKIINNCDEFIQTYRLKCCPK